MLLVIFSLLTGYDITQNIHIRLYIIMNTNPLDGSRRELVITPLA